ncbi:hypothetical protein GCM10009112_24190 [Marinomonas arenicola]
MTKVKNIGKNPKFLGRSYLVGYEGLPVINTYNSNAFAVKYKIINDVLKWTSGQ